LLSIRAYDANGQRVERITAAGQVHYIFDENGSVIVERDQSKTVRPARNILLMKSWL
jgi:hypothetical protein